LISSAISIIRVRVGFGFGTKFAIIGPESRMTSMS
jgi:hypothetical protein